MNFAHIHLAINHIPMIGLPIALIFLVYGYRTNNRSTQHFALLVLSAIALVVLPTYLSGEEAEEMVEHLPGISESLIENHEEAAEVSLILTLLTSAFAVLGLWFRNQELRFRKWVFLVFTFSIFSIGSLVYTANLGGEIRHSEIRK